MGEKAENKNRGLAQTIQNRECYRQQQALSTALYWQLLGYYYEKKKGDFL